MTFTLPAVVHGHAMYRFADTDASDVHEFGIIRLNPGVTAAAVIARVKHPAGPPPFTSAGGYGAVPPGSGRWLRLNLAPGHYAAICFVPDNAAPHAPHAAMGMVVPFTVPPDPSPSATRAAARMTIGRPRQPAGCNDPAGVRPIRGYPVTYAPAQLSITGQSCKQRRVSSRLWRLPAGRRGSR